MVQIATPHADNPDVVTCPHCGKDAPLPPDESWLKSREFLMSFPCPHCGQDIYLQELPEGSTGVGTPYLGDD